MDAKLVVKLLELLNEYLLSIFLFSKSFKLV
jgi:hypothetical protein